MAAVDDTRRGGMPENFHVAANNGFINERNRAMKTNLKDYLIFAGIFAIWLGCFYAFFGHIEFDYIVISFLGTILTIFIIFVIIGIKWRLDNGIDLCVTLESDPEKVKNHMLFIMRHGHPGGIKAALNEFNDIFRNYPQWELQNWEVFRAWYKDLMDHAVKNPEIYSIRMKDGSTYSRDTDPLYDREAPDWDQFDPRDYDEYDDEEDDDDGSDDDDGFSSGGSSGSLRKAAKDGFMMGIGYGIAKNILKS